MKRLMCTAMSLCLLLGVAAAETKTSTKKSAAKSAPAAASAKAADASSAHVKAYTPEQMKWSAGPNALPAGAQLAVLEGDPMKMGPVTIRLKFRTSYQLRRHSH